MLVHMEQALPVELYGWEEFPSFAGQRTLDYVKGLGIPAELVSSEFLGHDSSNPTHACAYYQVTLDVPDDQVESLKTLLDLE